jgi:hypothetical protein
VEASAEHEHEHNDFDENTADAVCVLANVEAIEWWRPVAVSADSFVFDPKTFAATSRQSAAVPADREEGVCWSVQKVWEVWP